MPKLHLILFTVFLAFTSCKSPEKSLIVHLTEDQIILSQQLAEYFSALAGLEKYNGAVLVRQEGIPILHAAYTMDGPRSLNVTKDSQFDVHSISKMMAKACFLRLEQDSLMSRDDVVSKYVPDFPQGDVITINHLLTHQSGLPRRFSNPVPNLIDKSPREVVDLIKSEAILTPPGAETLYSNLGYQLLYYIISEVTGKPFVQHLRDSIFETLAMDDSGAHFHCDKSKLTRPVTNHTMDDDTLTAQPNYESSDKNQSRVYSTLTDLSHFINFMKYEPYRSFLKSENGTIGHSGGGEGILAHVSTDLNQDYDLIFFSNYDEIPFGQIIKDVNSIMTGKPYVIPKAINRTAVQLPLSVMQSFVGKYDMAEFHHDEFEIRIENDSLAFYQNGEFGGMLKAENDTILFGDPKDEDYFVLRQNAADGFNDLIYKYKGVDIVGKRK